MSATSMIATSFPQLRSPHRGRSFATAIAGALGAAIFAAPAFAQLQFDPAPVHDRVDAGLPGMIGGRGGCPADWLPVTGFPADDGFVTAMVSLPDGDLLASGAFQHGSTWTNQIARRNHLTGAWSVFLDGLSPAMLVLPDGDLVIGGSFTSIAGVPANLIARLDSSTGVWSPLGRGVVGNIDPFVAVLALMPNGDIVAGGRFDAAGGMPANNIARWDPVTETWSAFGSSVNAPVSALLPLPNGDLIVGGYFNQAGSLLTNRVVRWNGSAWVAMGTGVGGGATTFGVRSLALRPNGDIVAGGFFSAPEWNLVRWDGVAWSTIGVTDANTGVIKVLAMPNGDIIAAGSFLSVDGVAAPHIARWNGAAWSPLGSGLNHDVRGLLLLPTNDLAVGGRFTQAGGQSADRFAVYSFGFPASFSSHPEDTTVCATGTASFSVVAAGTGPFSYQWQVNIADPQAAPLWCNLTDLQPGGGCLGNGGGGLSHALFQGVNSPTLMISSLLPVDARDYQCAVVSPCGIEYSNPATLSICFADVNCDGTVGSQDFFDFIAAFFSGNADFNFDGATTSQDYFDFLAAFFTGC